LGKNRRRCQKAKRGATCDAHESYSLQERRHGPMTHAILCSRICTPHCGQQAWDAHLTS
jgi:hypothetical protein